MGCSVVRSSISYLLSALLSLLGRGALVALVGVYCQLYVNLRQNSEDVSLQHGDEDFERVEDYRRGHGYDRHHGSRHGEETARIKDEAQENEDDQVPRQHVGVEPYGQRDRPGYLTQGVDKEHERGHKDLDRQTRGNPALEIGSGAVAPDAHVVRENERDQGQSRGEGEVARHGITVGEEPYDVQRQQEHEDGERVGEPFHALLAYLAAEVAAPEAVDLLHDHLVGAWPVLEQPGPDKKDHERDGGPEKQEPDDLVYGEVDGADVYGDYPGMLGGLPGVQDLGPQLLLAYLRQHELTPQMPTFRRSLSDSVLSLFVPARLTFLGIIGNSTTFSAR